MVAGRVRVAEVIKRLQGAGIEVSLFIDPDPSQIAMSRELGVGAVELHTGAYADALTESEQQAELTKLVDAGTCVREHGMLLHMGHGLTYRNVIPVASIDDVSELNIGHSIISRAVLVGMERAVREMKQLCTI